MAQILQPHELPVALNELEPSQAAGDLLHALQKLRGCVEDVLARVGDKVQAERARLAGINARVAACQRKVAAVRGSSKATTVFSTSKYPAPRKVPNNATLFCSKTDVDPAVYPEPDEEVDYRLAHPDLSVIRNKELAGEIDEMVKRLNPAGTEMVRVEIVMEEDGLGSLPRHVPSVSSLLLFNSRVNPYKNYSALDNLEGAGRTRAATVEQLRKGLASAPTSVMLGADLPDIMALDVTFKPQMGEMTQLSLPSNLELPNVADLSFSADLASLPSIAPSAFQTSQLTLPAITNFAAPPSAKEVAASSSAAPPPPASAAAPPPPPPSNNAAAAAAAAPPPPPPGASANNNNAPPPPTPTQVPAPAPPLPTAKDAAAGAAPAAVAADTGRASLMDAIRGKGVAALKSAAERKVVKQKETKKNVKPMSIMDEIRGRLKRRSEVMSGKADRVQQKREARAYKMGATAEDDDEMSLSSADDDDDEDGNGLDAIPEVQPVVIPRTQKTPATKTSNSKKQAVPETGAARGSLFDTQNKTLNKLLSAGQQADRGDKSDGSDWDE